jgi:mannan endo-1,6-alpha-mannosidase
MAAMSAAENNFPDPPSDSPQWLALAQAVFNSQALRWDNETCGGGLRWQIFQYNNGYDYKNSISNGCFFNLGARLARYTGNQTYADWAEKVFAWEMSIGLIDKNYNIFDGSDTTINCTQVDHLQWTYNGGIYLHGVATMYNVTNGSSVWKSHLDGIIAANKVFFSNASIMVEVACENNNNCDVDQQSFKAYLSRWMAATIQMAPYTHDTLLPLLQSSAAGAAAACSGGGNICGFKWTTGQYDGVTGVGEQMSAISVFGSTLIDLVAAPVTAVTGGTSVGDPSAGTGGDTTPGTFDPATVTTGSKVGASFLTLFAIIGVVGGSWWMIS